MSYGLTGFGHALGERLPLAAHVTEVASDPEVVLQYGYRNVHRCEPATGLTELARRAGEQALLAAGAAAADIDLLVLAITDIPEYLYWDVAASLQYRLGAHRAEAVLLTQACAGGVVAFDTLAGKFQTHPDYQSALLVTVNRTAEPYWSRAETQPLVFSDGAAAAVAVRSHDGFRWRTTQVLTDGRFADFFRLDVGGAASPFPQRETRARDAWDVMEHFDYDAARFTEFMKLLDTNVRIVVEQACARAGIAPAEIRRFILVHDNQRALQLMADELGVPIAITNADLAAEHGHLGAADFLFSLSHYARDGSLTGGDLVALVARGRGMHWACTMLEV